MAVILPSVYKDGTATVVANGTAVTGQNTLWLNSILPGDFWGVHKGLPIRIATVNSNTSITLANPWPGAAQTAAAYEIMLQSDNARMQETSRQLLTALSSGNAYSLSTLASAADTLPYFTGAGTMGITNLSPFMRTLLDDLNATAAYGTLGIVPNAQFPERLRSLTDPKNNVDTISENGFFSATGQSSGVPYSGGAWLIHSHFWSDANFAVQDAYNLFNSDGAFRRFKVSGSWLAWFSAGAKTVGTVVRSGALSTGSVIERGSNANGEYTRFADGTQECWGNFTGYTANVSKVVNTPVNFAAQRNPAFASVTPIQIVDTDFSVWSDGNGPLTFISTTTSASNRVDWFIKGRWY